MDRKAHVHEVCRLGETAHFDDRLFAQISVVAWEEFGKRSSDHLPHKVCFSPFAEKCQPARSFR